jgi:DNA-binding transcriptional LysR family regulator
MLLDGVDIFIEVVKAQSFSRAAQRLGLPPTTVSARIKRLEERLGTQLLLRTTRRLSLTDAGERFYAHCSAAIEAVLAGEQAVATTLVAPRGRLRITAPADLAQSVLVPVIKAYLARYPEVTIELLVSNQFRDLVAEGIDLAVRVGELPNSSLIGRRFLSSALGLWAAPDYLVRHGTPQQLTDLSGHIIIRLSSARRGLILHDGDDRLDVDSLACNLRVDDMQTCEALARGGLGIALLPMFTRSDGLIRLLPQLHSGAFTVHFLYPHQNQLPPTVRSFIDLALQSVQPMNP